ncbi:MAG: DNA primase [Elusimicrobia bacterium]|nr:DNA primase [Elusimicrobiota bacterium]
MQNNIETLRSRLNLVELARDYVRELRHSGKSWTGLCPFHDEKTPSFHMNEERGLYYCFGCKRGGDAIKLFMEIERVDFKEAVEFLSERVGLPRPVWSLKKTAASGEDKLRDEVRQALRLAAELYRQALWLREEPLAHEARQYAVKKRGLSKALLEKLGTGLAPKGPSWLYSTLVTKHGINPRAIEKAGLCVTSSRDGRYLDFFRSRLVFPVLDLQGRAIAFGGRSIPSQAPLQPGAAGAWGVGAAAQGPKYLNSPDTPFFKKGETLYGLTQNKEAIKDKGRAYLVEGYFDVAGLAEAGLELAVSPMGGALTAEQARLLKRFAGEVTLIFDPDAAGISSAISAGRILISAGFQIRVMSLPEKLDPDEYVLKYGRSAFENLERQGTKSLVDFELEYLLAGRPLTALHLSQRQMVCRQMLTTLGLIQGEIERRDAVGRVAQLLRVDPMGLERELWRQGSASTSGFRGKAYAGSRSAPAVAAVTSAKEFISLEEALLALYCREPDTVRQALTQARVRFDDLSDRRIAAFMFRGEVPQDDEGRHESSWQDLVSRSCVSYDRGDRQEPFVKSVTDLVAGLRRRSLQKEFDALQQDIRSRRAQSQPAGPELLSRLQELTKALKNETAVI